MVDTKFDQTNKIAVAAEPKKKKTGGRPRKKKYSILFITINPNESVGSTEDALAKGERIAKWVQDRFGSGDEAMARYIRTRPANAFTEDKVESVDITSAIELGDKQHRVHVHVQVSATHYLTDFKVNLQNLRADLKKEYGHNVHVDVKAVQSNQYLIDYLRKGGKIEAMEQRADAASSLHSEVELLTDGSEV